MFRQSTITGTRNKINREWEREDKGEKEFLDDLEHLTELSEEELEDLSERVKHFHVSGNKKHDRMNQNKRTNQD